MREPSFAFLLARSRVARRSPFGTAASAKGAAALVRRPGPAVARRSYLLPVLLFASANASLSVAAYFALQLLLILSRALSLFACLLACLVAQLLRLALPG